MSQPTTNPPPDSAPRAEDFAFSRLICFGRYINSDFIHPRHIRLLARKLEEVERQGGKRIIISIPPRHGKSFLTSQIFPAWFLGRNPKKYIITISYGDELATDFGRAVRNYVGDPLYQRVFPGVTLSRDSRSSSRFNTSEGGSYFAVGVGGAITGRGAHLLVVDDLIKNWEEAQSKTVRKNIIDWFLSTAYTRLQPNGSVILVNTRWHDEDLPGYLLKHDKGNKWEEICLAALDENDEPLAPEFYSKEELQQIRTTLGSRIFSPLYQGKPVPEEGGIINGAWFRRYDRVPTDKPIRIIQSWDTAIKDDQLNDFSVCTTWFEFPGRFYLVDVLRGRWSYPALKKAARDHRRHHKPDIILIEDKGNGSSLISEMRLEEDSPPILAINPDCSKQARFVRVSPRIEAGMVFLPNDAPWLADYEAELIGFPTMEHDDQVDSTSQALDYMRKILFAGAEWEEQLAEIPLQKHWDYSASIFWRHDSRPCAILFFGISEDKTVYVFGEESLVNVLPQKVAEVVIAKQAGLPIGDDNNRKEFLSIIGNPDLWAKRGVQDTSAMQFESAGVVMDRGYDDDKQGLVRIREYREAGKLKISPSCRQLISALKTMPRHEKDDERGDSDGLTAGRFVDALWNFLLNRPLASDNPKTEKKYRTRTEWVIEQNIKRLKSKRRR